MFRFKTLTAGLMTGILATTALASVDLVSKVDVTTDLSAIQNPKAAEYWAKLDTDLEGAIAVRLTERLGEEGAPGAEVLVDIREVELASAFERKLNLGDAVLVGQVNIKDDTDNQNYDAYELSVSLESAMIVLTEGEQVVLADTNTEETYRKLVDTFADEVVKRLN